MRTRTYQMSAKANKMSKERKTHKYDCAKEANAYKNISNERTNQGARAPLDRESAPKKKKKKTLKARNKLTGQQREQRKRKDQTRTKASGKDKKNRKKQA